MAIEARDGRVSDERAMAEMMELLDGWKAPEPSPWFDARMMARFREEVERQPEGWFARLHNRFVLGDSISMRPLMAGAMALLLVAGAGSYLEMAHLQSAGQPATSATVQDLQILDNNDQAIQQMDQLLDSNDNSGSGGNQGDTL